MITIVNYGMGNLGSVQNMLKRIGHSSVIQSDPDAIRKAQKLILPGVGAFDTAMQCLLNSGIKEALDEAVMQHETPVLGICLGMQLLTSGSEEGQLPGLNWIPGMAHKFPNDIPNLKVPHMGWNTIQITHPNLLTSGMTADTRFYFVHSYYVSVDRDQDRTATTRHGIPFDSMINRGHIFGAQFHPEKSHRFGMQLLSNFCQ